MCNPSTVSTNLTLPVRRLDQTLKAWHESRISSASGEFDLGVSGLNFVLSSTTHTLFSSPQETQDLGALFQSCTTPTSTHRATATFRKMLLEMLARVCVPRSLRKIEEMVTGLQSNIIALCMFPSSLHNGLHHFSVQNPCMASHWPFSNI